MSTGQRYRVCITAADSGQRRSPLSIAVSKPGESLFSRVFVIRPSISEQTPGISAPNADFSYPCASNTKREALHRLHSQEPYRERTGGDSCEQFGDQTVMPPKFRGVGFPPANLGKNDRLEAYPTTFVGDVNLRCPLTVPISEVLARIAPHVLGQSCEAETAPWPHYQGELRETDFKLIAPPRFGHTDLGLRKGPRYTRLPIAIVGTMTAQDGETLVQARVSLTGWSWSLVIGMPLGMLLMLSALLYPIYSLNHAQFIKLVGITSGVTAVLSVLMSWLSLSLDKADFRNILHGHARR